MALNLAKVVIDYRRFCRQFIARGSVGADHFDIKRVVVGRCARHFLRRPGGENFRGAKLALTALVVGRGRVRLAAEVVVQRPWGRATA